MKRYCLLLGVLGLLLWSHAGAAHTRITSLTGATPSWLESPIPYSVNDRGLAEIPNGSELVAVRAAFDAWEAVASADVDFDFRGTTSLRGVGLDGTNLVTFADDSGLLGSTTLAATFSFFKRSGGELRFEESDIAFNPNHEFTTSGESGRFDIQSVLTHEAGHMLGLDHSGLISSVMVPFASPDQTDQRVLMYDDIAGITQIYPASGAQEVGSIEGRVQVNGVDIFGAHVVAIDSNGTPLVGVATDRSGAYSIPFLPPGDYHVYTEPLDRPVSSAQLPGFFASIMTNFGTTYFGDVQRESEARTVTLVAGEASSGTDIRAVPRSSNSFNLTRPVFALRIPQGSRETLRVGGDNVVSGATFESSSSRIFLDEVTFGGRLSRTARRSASIEIGVSADAQLGPKNVTGFLEDATSVVSGAVVITEEAPDAIEVSPVTASFEGGGIATIMGSGFRVGLSVFFGGLRAEGVVFLNSGMLQVTVPANAPGPVNIQVFNSDGTSGLLVDGFTYTAPPPTVSLVTPLEGPPGTLVTIEGESFDVRPRNIVVNFNGQSGRIVSTTRTRIETVVPFGATSGTLSLSVFGVTVDGPRFTVTESDTSTNIAPAAFQFVDATPAGGGTNISFANSDDAVHFMDLPFTFSLFRDTFIAGSGISIATNGWLSLDAASTPEFQNASLPAQTVERPSGSDGVIPAALIAPFFDDLTFAGGGRASTLLTGSVGSRRFVVQWSNASILDSVGTDLAADLTFELILFEGSNDIQFVYRSMSGERSDGSSATVGLQNLLRNDAVQSGFNQAIVGNGVAFTYRFDGGTYVEDIGDQSPPTVPSVTDGGERIPNRGELFASWSTDSGSSIRHYEYAIGTTPGGTDVRSFTVTENNSVVVGGLVLENDQTYYFVVRATSVFGLVSEVGLSDGIRVDASFEPTVHIFPAVPHDEGTFGGIALQATVATDVVLRAIDIDGVLTLGPGIRNPASVHLEPGEQWARLIPEIFGAGALAGWFELEASEPDLRAYMTTGRTDLVRFDGARSASPLKDFFLFHEGANAILVNPSAKSVTATITQLATGMGQPFEIPARSRRTTPLTGPVRITSPDSITGVEHFGSDEDLGIGETVPALGQSTLTFPHAVVGGGYSSWVTIANVAGSPRTVQISFVGASKSLQLAGGGSIRVSIASFLGISGNQIQTDAVRIAAGSVFGSSSSLVGVIDIESTGSVVTLAPVEAATDILFPHVAHGNGFYTGIALAAGAAEATVTIEVFPASGGTPKTGTVVVASNGQIARLVSELVPEVTEQSGGYIRLTSDQPVWAWEIYGTDFAMASGPPL